MLTVVFFLVQIPSWFSVSHLEVTEKKIQPQWLHRRLEPAGTICR